MSLSQLGIKFWLLMCLFCLSGISQANQTEGAWSDVFDWPVVGIHMVQLHTGEILVWSSGSEEAQVLDPTEDMDCFDQASGCFTQKPSGVEIFCAGQTQLDDGTVIVNGGHIQNNVGEPDTLLFGYNHDTDDWNWSAVEDTDHARWYPTLTTLADARVLNVSGTQKRCSSGPNQDDLCREHEDCEPVETENCEATHVATSELFDYASQKWVPLPSITESVQYYSFNFVDPDGTVFVAGADTGASGFDIAPSQSVTINVDDESLTLGPVSNTDGGSAAMYGPGLIIKTGGSAPGTSTPAIADAEIIDLNGAATWMATDPMNIPRRRHNLTVLPDGTVLATGGTRSRNKEFEIEETCGGTDGGAVCGSDDDCTAPLMCEKHVMGEQFWVAEAELWDPATGAWTTMAGGQLPRMYHSTALLLRDGRVLSAGGGRGGGAVSNYPNAEIYSPPYLFTDTPRPTVSDVPKSITYGQAFVVQSPEAADVDRISLIRLGAVTHSFDQNRRFLELGFNKVGDYGIEINAPASANDAPPGYYMLFVLSAEGVPSVAEFVRILPNHAAEFEYTAKVTCGIPDDRSPAGLVAGQYSTSINIHNPSREPVRFFKKLALTSPPGRQKVGDILPITEHLLEYDEALQVDCQDLRERLIPGGSAPYFEGFLVLQSQGSLDVTDVYSTASLTSGNAHSSVDIEQIHERASVADLRINKTVNTVPLNFGALQVHFALYTIQITNSGPGSASNVVLEDDLALDVSGGIGNVEIIADPITLPPGALLTSLSKPAINLASMVVELADIPAGETQVVQFWAVALPVGLADANLGAILRDTASVTSTSEDENPANNLVTIQTVLVQ